MNAIMYTEVAITYTFLFPSIYINTYTHRYVCVCIFYIYVCTLYLISYI